MIEYTIATIKSGYPFAIITFGAGEVIGEKSPISLGLAFVMIGCAIYIVKNLQKHTDAIKNIAHRVSNIEFILKIRAIASKEEKETTT